jgi:hypothetical protein
MLKFLAKMPIKVGDSGFMLKLQKLQQVIKEQKRMIKEQKRISSSKKGGLPSMKMFILLPFI